MSMDETQHREGHDFTQYTQVYAIPVDDRAYWLLEANITQNVCSGRRVALSCGSDCDAVWLHAIGV